MNIFKKLFRRNVDVVKEAEVTYTETQTTADHKLKLCKDAACPSSFMIHYH